MTEGGGFEKIIGENESVGQILSMPLPKEVKLVKSFGTLGAAHQTPEKAVLFYATVDTSINGEIEVLICDSGFELFHIGGLDQSNPH